MGCRDAVPRKSGERVTEGAIDRLGHMRVFVRVVECGSFSAAARDLDRTQSAASKHILALERHLGARLMSRTTRSARPPDAATGSP